MRSRTAGCDDLSFVLQLVFDTLVVHYGEADLLSIAGETFYSLLCLQPHEIMMVFNEVSCVFFSCFFLVCSLERSPQTHILTL